jgi:HPt (histidine-containing phosphotransfer) domain-containing protein
METNTDTFQSDYYDNIDNLDKETIKMLEEHSANNPELVRDIFDSFKPEADELMVKIKDAIDERDLETLRSNAHSMAGICGSIGALRLYTISKDIEMEIKTGDGEKAIALARNMFMAYRELLELIENL